MAINCLVNLFLGLEIIPFLQRYCCEFAQCKTKKSKAETYFSLKNVKIRAPYLVTWLGLLKATVSPIQTKPVRVHYSDSISNWEQTKI